MAIRSTSNQFFVRMMNPYDPIMWIDFPIEYEQPDLPVVEPPEYTIEDFKNVFAVEFEGYIEEGMTMNPLYKAFEKIAVKFVNFKLLGEDEDMWRYLVSMYIAHNLELAMARIKNQADEISMTPEKSSDKKISHKMGQSTEDAYSQTKYGYAFYLSYKPYAKMRFFGVYSSKGVL